MKRYLILGTLILINILSYVDRHLLPAFGSQISAELDLSRQEFGLITGFAFILVYAISGPLVGVLADRFNPVRVVTFGLVIWSLMTALTARASSFLGLLLPRMAIGVGEASLHPSAAAILARIFDSKNRATVLSVFFVGSHIGLGLAYWLAGSLGESLGWRNMFLLLGLLGLVFCLPLLAIAPEIGKLKKAEKPDQNDAPPLRDVLATFLSALRKSASFRLAILAFSALHMLYASSQYMQIWLSSEKDFDDSAASTLYGAAYLMIGIPSALTGGFVCDWFTRRFGTSRALFVALIVALSAPLLLAFRLMPADSTWFYIGMGAAIFLVAFPYGAAVAIILDHSPATVQATATGFAMFAANVLVIGPGTWLVGAVADWLEVYDIGLPLTKTLIGADMITLLCAAFYLRLHFHDKVRLP